MKLQLNDQFFTDIANSKRIFFNQSLATVTAVTLEVVLFLETLEIQNNYRRIFFQIVVVQHHSPAILKTVIVTTRKINKNYLDTFRSRLI